MVESVEQLAAELELDPLGDPVLAEQRQIHILQRLGTKNVAAGIAVRKLPWRRESSLVEPGLRARMIDMPVADNVGPRAVGVVDRADIGDIRVRLRRERLAAAQRDD